MHVPADKLVERGLAHVPEGRRVFAQMSVEENLEMGAYTRPNSEIAPGLERVYAHFPAPQGAPPPGCRHAFRRRASRCSAMGRALMSAPQVADAR